MSLPDNCFPQGISGHRVSGWALLQICALFLLLFGVSRLEAQLPLYGDTGAHDPSTLVKEGNRFFFFVTSQDLEWKWSDDMRNWNLGGTVFPDGPPAWTTNAVPGFTGFFWAPDVAYFNGKYHVYYSCSNWGTIDSAIGLVTTPSLDTPVWTDQGKVVQSDAVGSEQTGTDTTGYNCIDPSILVDTDGKVWMTFGSYSSGILITEIDPATGLRKNTNTLDATQVANNSGNRGWGSSIEAAFTYKHDGYYYLFVNYGGCCALLDSTYNIRVGRSISITGPYLDKNGVDMRDGGAAMLLESSGRFVGPGHAGIINDNSKEWFSYHYYSGFENGFPRISIARLTWDARGWPVVAADWQASYPFDIDGRDQNGVYGGSLENGASIVDDGERGKVLSLTGANQDVSFPFSLANARSFAAWVKWSGGPAWQRVFDFGVDTNTYAFLTPSDAAGKMLFAIRNGGVDQNLEASMALPQNEWCHVAVTLEKTGKGTLYLNGAPVATGAITIAPWQLLSRNLFLGKSQWANDPYFSGRIDDFRVYSRTLSGGEVAQLAGTKIGGARAVAYWNFEEGAADTYVPYGPASAGSYDGSVRDVTGNGNHLSAWDKDWEWYRASVPAATTSATGAANTLSVQNANTVPALSAIGTGLTNWTPARWTIEAAIRPDAVSTFQTIVGRDSYGAYSPAPALASLYLSVRPGGVLAISFTDAAGNNWDLNSAANAIVAQKWQAVAATSDGKTLKLYRRNLTDGEAKYTLLSSLDISSSTNAALHPGAGVGADWDRGVISVGRGLFNGVHTDRFLGYIDDVRLSESALGPSEFLYRSNPTVAHSNFEEGTANTYVPYSPATAGAYDGSMLDVSGNGNPLSAWTSNHAWYRSLVPLPTTPRTGLANKLSVQNATSLPSYSAIGTGLTNWSPSEWTLEAAIRPDSVAGYQTIIGRDSYGANDGNPAAASLYFSIRPGGVLAIAFTDAAGNVWNLESAANAIVAGQWQSIAATSNGVTLRLYRRNITTGAAAYSLLGNLDISGSSNPELSLGAGDGADWDRGVITVARGLFNGVHTDRFLGYLDDVRLSSAALTPDQFLYVPQPAMPTNVVATAGVGKITLSWAAVADATSYSVKRSDVSGGPYASVGSGLATTSFVNDPVTAGTPYYYVVTAVRDGVESLPSSQVSATALTPAQFWRQTHFGTTANSGDAADGADPDNDGMINVHERAFGADPNTFDRNLLPRVDPTATVLSITYRKAKAATDLTFAIQQSDLVSGWTPAIGTSEVLSDSDEVQLIRFTSPPGGANKGFLRVAVELSGS